MERLSRDADQRGLGQLRAADGRAGHRREHGSGRASVPRRRRWTKRLHPGWGALAGITAAHLARHGFAGPSRPYEGRFALVRCEAQQDCDFPRYFSGEVIVRMRDGTTHGEHVPVNLGSGERALDAQDIEAKFRGTAGLTLPQDRVNALLDTLMAGGRRKVRAITKLLQVA
jgi:2-methylcitrate dehydratase PrpD